jgi:hypothetical protein
MAFISGLLDCERVQGFSIEQWRAFGWPAVLALIAVDSMQANGSSMTPTMWFKHTL